MDNPEGLLNLFQLCDSFFPSGSFAYSWGLETYTSEGLIRDRAGLIRFIQGQITGLMSRCDCRVVSLTYQAAQKGDLAALIKVDTRLHSLKLVRETREGSLQTGRQLLKVLQTLVDSSLLEAFAQEIREGRSFGHHPVVFGAGCQTLRSEREQAVLAHLYAAVSGLVSAGVRLIPLGHTDGQIALQALKPLILQTVEETRAFEGTEEDLFGFAPALEIRAMKHEGLYSRLFKS